MSNDYYFTVLLGLFKMKYNYLSKVIRDEEGLVLLSEKLEKEGKVISLVNGTFDIFHRGHLKLIEEASKCGDVLVVLINSDSSIRKIKGEGRPYHREEDRIKLVSSLVFVDYVFVFEEERITKYLYYLRPKYWIKGSDYIGKVEKSELEAANELGVNIVYVDREEDKYSTSNIIKLIESWENNELDFVSNT